MPIITLDYDLADVSTSNDPVPAGTYECKITKAELTTAKTGSPMIKVTWEIIDGEFVGKPLWDNVTLSVPWKVKQYALVVGIESGTELDTEAFIGAEAILDVIVEKYVEPGTDPDTSPGKPVNKIKRVTPIS